MKIEELEKKVNRIEDVVNLYIKIIKSLYHGKKMVSRNIETNILFRIATSLMGEINKTVEQVQEERRGKDIHKTKMDKDCKGYYS